MICRRRKKIPLAFVALLVCGGFSYYISTTMYKSTSQTKFPQLHNIDNRISGPGEAIHGKRGGTERTTGTCIPRKKFVFIATHKTGTVTTSNIFQRYAINHKLAVLVATAGNPVSWGRSPAEEDYIHTPDEQYDALFNHLTYNKTWLRSKFPANTAYISIIREPSSQLTSAMHYYYLPQLLQMRGVNNPVNELLLNPWKYKHLSEVHFDFCNITWDPTRNFMSFDLGYPAEGAEDEEWARRYISELEADFTLVMLLEYLDESLVLLRRLMCWEMQDVFYVTKNNRTYSYKKSIPSNEQISNLRKWKAVDYLLYDTFNTSLWRKIAAQGSDFHEEVYYFREVNTNVNTYCDERQEGTPNLTVVASRWNPQFEVDAKFCHVIQSRVEQLMVPLRKGHKGGRTILSERVNVWAVAKGQRTFKYRDEREEYVKMLNESTW
ncbi:galactosylceramide sulfotransferase-like [Branchiostoma floridae]|uniref:Galactosylceramide sulfotransferase-like n=1 Tax=Branchiostoma floridae TaxID=7739 RepID=A0A9J7KV08_BRAFL|nr:galactosylceramide sulfotransferase-like [Branchiostoma floridae]